MKYQIDKATKQILGTYENNQDVESWGLDKDIYEIMTGDDLMTLNESLEWIPDKNKINQRFSDIDKEFGNRYIRDFALNNSTAVHDIAYQKIQTAESEAVNLRKLL